MAETAAIAFEEMAPATALPRLSARAAPQTTETATPEIVITAVIVSRDRPAELRKTLAAVLAQNIVPALHVVVLDSSRDSSAIADIVAGLPNVSVIRTLLNLGGAGGFALGMLTAMAGGAEWLWLMDDDGRPGDDFVLSNLLQTAARRELHAVSPAVLAAEDPSLFAFPYPVDGRYVFHRDELASDAFLLSTAHLFNGMLIRTSALFQVGLPDLRMFTRGDEIDFMHRMRRAKLRFGTTATAAFLHPSSNEEVHPIWGGRLHVVIPQTAWKRRCQFRNRAFNFSRHRMWLILAVDAVRYPYFFLIRRNADFAGLKEWLSCSWAGLCGHVGLDLTPDTGAPADQPLL